MAHALELEQPRARHRLRHQAPVLDRHQHVIDPMDDQGRHSDLAHALEPRLRSQDGNELTPGPDGVVRPIYRALCPCAFIALIEGIT